MRTKTPAQADKILDAASRLFGTHPFHEVLMDDIAAEAEVGKGTLYRYFSDKEDLYTAILTRASEEFTQRMRERVEEREEPRDQLEAVVADIIAYFDGHPHLLELILRAELLRKPGTEFPWQQTRDDLVRLLVGVLEQGQRRGQFTTPEPELAVLMLLGGVRAVIRFGKQPRPANLGTTIVAGFLDGYAEKMCKAKKGN